MCVWVWRGWRVWTSAFDFQASDNISSPAGKQFIRPSGVLFNGSLQATTVLWPLYCGQHADHKWISKSSSNKAFKNNYEPHLKPVSSRWSHCLTVYDPMQMIPLHVGLCTILTWNLQLKTIRQKVYWCKTLRKLYGLTLWAEVQSAFSYIKCDHFKKYKYFWYVEFKNVIML